MNDRLKFRVWAENKIQKASYGDDFCINQEGELACINVSTGEHAANTSFLSVEQCTGLKDKNGKLIYENDFVLLNGEICQVIWSEEDCAFFFSNLKETYRQPIYPDVYIMSEDFKVVGNIHENPELLKGDRT